VLYQHIDRSLAPGCVRPSPALGAEACAGLSFRLFSEVVYEFEDNRDTCAFADGVASAQNPRRPGVVALEYCSGGKRDQNVHETVFVLKIPDACDALPHQRDRLIGVPAPDRQDGANIQRAQREPWPGMSKHGGGLIEQALRLAGIAGRKNYSRQPAQHVPGAPQIPRRFEPFNTAREPVARRVQIAKGVFDAPGKILGQHDHIHVAGGMGEREAAHEPVACAPELSLPEPHQSRSHQRSGPSEWRKRRQIQSLFIPLEALGLPPDHPEPHQPPRDLGRFGRTAALDQPRQSPKRPRSADFHRSSSYCRLYERRTGGVRNLSLLASAPALHSGHMANGGSASSSALPLSSKESSKSSERFMS
jgi:hypothetical protein